MADKTTTKFPTMGTEAATVTNVSGTTVSGTLVPKSGNAKGGAGEPATANARSGSIERNGFKGAPQVNHVYANAPEASQTFRNVRLVPSAVGNRDFYARRQYGQNS